MLSGALTQNGAGFVSSNSSEPFKTFKRNQLPNTIDEVNPATLKIFQLLDIVFGRLRHNWLLERLEKESEKDKGGEREKEKDGVKEMEIEKEEGEKKEEEVGFINPMVFDRLGTEDGLFEIKYLVFLPFNGDPPLFTPEHGRIIHDKAGVELALPQIKGRFEQFRWTNQIELRESKDTIELFQLLIDGYMREVIGAVLGVYINISRIGKHWQQVFMYGVKVKPGFERFLDPKQRPPVQPYIFDVARQMGEVGGGGLAGTAEAVFSQVDSGGILINYTLMFTRFPKFLMGLEVLFFYDVNNGKYSYLAFYPQIQVQFTNEVKIDVGPGFILTPFKFIPEFVSRILIENFPGVEKEGKEKEKENKGEKEKEVGKGEEQKEEKDKQTKKEDESDVPRQIKTITY